MRHRTLTRDALPHVSERIQRLGPNTPPQWGTMNAAQACNHLTLSIQASIGEIDVQDQSTLAYRLVRPLLYSGLLPKPKGKVSAPTDFLPAENSDFEQERDALLAVLDRFVERAEREPLQRFRHPFFGLLTLRQWQRGHALHLDYHLEQFGV